MSIYLSFFSLFLEIIHFKARDILLQSWKAENQRTFIFLFYELVKHETYWQMLELDRRCHAISFKFIFTLNDSGGFYFLKSYPNFFQCLKIEKTEGHMTCYLFYWNNHMFMNGDTEFIFCGTGIYSYQWKSRYTLPFKDSMTFSSISKILMSK